MTVDDKLKRSGPRKLLALDGGGIRGLITIEVLAEIERLLRKDSDAGDERRRSVHSPRDVGWAIVPLGGWKQCPA